MKRITMHLLASMAVCLLSLSVRAQDNKPKKLDILIKGAYVFDGTGKDSVLYDVGIKGERIVYVGEPTKSFKAKTLIDGTGLYLSPGFIDPHTHYKRQLNNKDEKERALLRALMQGVTTVFEGNDGGSPWPIGETLHKWKETGIGPNAALFVGHNTVRRNVLGDEDVQPTANELKTMENMVDRAMKEGAFGLSTGLFYTPGNYAELDEVVALAKVAASHGGIYDTHQRDEGSQSIGVVASTEEVLKIAEEAGIPAHISHIKVSGPKTWGKSDVLIDMIEKAQAKGLKVTANQYPYEASRTGLSSALVPPWVRDGGIKAMRARFLQPELRDSILKGIAKNIEARTADPSKLVLASKKNKELHGKSLQDLSEQWNISPEEVVIKVCSTSLPSVHSFMMKDEDINNFMVQPWVMTGSDGGSGHPRGFGTFARKIRKYALDDKVLSVSQAIYKSSYLTAKTLNIKDRGAIEEGYYADVVLFDPNTIKDNSNYDNGEVLASGVPYVIVNGKLVIKDGQWQGNLPGKALKLNEK
ncbi:N-acyl-D-amino-acid deacylase family protein [Sinomicrobium sp.]